MKIFTYLKKSVYYKKNSITSNRWKRRGGGGGGSSGDGSGHSHQGNHAYCQRYKVLGMHSDGHKSNTEIWKCFPDVMSIRNQARKFQWVVTATKLLHRGKIENKH